MSVWANRSRSCMFIYSLAWSIDSHVQECSLVRYAHSLLFFFLDRHDCAACNQINVRSRNMNTYGYRMEWSALYKFSQEWLKWSRCSWVQYSIAQHNTHITMTFLFLPMRINTYATISINIFICGLIITLFIDKGKKSVRLRFVLLLLLLLFMFHFSRVCAEWFNKFFLRILIQNGI